MGDLKENFVMYDEPDLDSARNLFLKSTAKYAVRHFSKTAHLRKCTSQSFASPISVPKGHNQRETKNGLICMMVKGYIKQDEINHNHTPSRQIIFNSAQSCYQKNKRIIF